MKLEVGMYLRHSGLDGEYPIIQKITKLKTPGRCGGKYKVYTDKCENWFIDSDYIELDESKYSFNIIDLIEENDVVVIRRNGDLYKYEVFSIPIFSEQKLYVYENVLGETTMLFLEDIPKEYIVSIVTKEQFKQMQYKVGE